VTDRRSDGRTESIIANTALCVANYMLTRCKKEREEKESVEDAEKVSHSYSSCSDLFGELGPQTAKNRTVLSITQRAAIRLRFATHFSTVFLSVIASELQKSNANQGRHIQRYLSHRISIRLITSRRHGHGGGYCIRDIFKRHACLKFYSDLLML